MESVGVLFSFGAPIGLFRLGAGVDVARRGLKERRRAALLRSLPMPPEAGPLPPLVKISRVVDDASACPSPVTGVRCVVLRYCLCPGPAFQGRAALTGILGSRFYLRTHLGRIAVETAGAQLPLMPAPAAPAPRLREL